MVEADDASDRQHGGGDDMENNGLSDRQVSFILNDGGRKE